MTMRKTALLGAAFGLAAGLFSPALPSRALAAETLAAGQPARQQPARQQSARQGAAEACTAEQLGVIGAAYRLAELRIVESIAFLDRNPQHRLTNRLFADAQRKTIRQSLTLTQAALVAGRRPESRCNAAACEADVVAFTMHDATWVNFCPIFFRLPAEGEQSRYGTVIHEVSHIVAHTRDAAYGPANLDLAKEHAEITPLNAQSLQLFVELTPR
jgi:hypothetical protein